MSNTTTRETASPTRGIDGHDLPTSGRWDIDPGHTDPAFVGRHFMVTRSPDVTDVAQPVTIADHFTLSRVVR